MGPGALSDLLGEMMHIRDPRVLVGYDTSDDAAVLAVDEDRCLIHTVDFFSPVVDDPYLFGQIAAANALSDVYAMGGEPFSALNIAALPEALPKQAAQGIMAGGAAVVTEAKALLVGGHTIASRELFFGMAVTGWCCPTDLLTNAGAQPGDVLLLTKPLGTGIVLNALRGDLLSLGDCHAMLDSMVQLNGLASRHFKTPAVHACTDITGFGLAGHALEMARGSGVELHFAFEKLASYDGSLTWASMGLVPQGTYANKEAFASAVLTEGLELCEEDLVFDPQTSGGLLIATAPDSARELNTLLKNHSVASRIVGRVVAGPPRVIVSRR